MKITLTKSEAEAMLASRFDVLQHEVSIEIPATPAPTPAPNLTSISDTIRGVQTILNIAKGGNLIDTTKEIRKQFKGADLADAVKMAKILLGRTDL